jgi:hypothetical protein
VTGFQAEFSCPGNCAKIVCCSNGDLIPSDYGTHHGGAATFCDLQCRSNKFNKPSLKRGSKQFSLLGHSTRNSRFIYVERITSDENRDYPESPEAVHNRNLK